MQIGPQGGARRSVDVESHRSPPCPGSRGSLSPKKSCSTWVIVMGNRDLSAPPQEVEVLFAATKLIDHGENAVM